MARARTLGGSLSFGMRPGRREGRVERALRRLWRDRFAVLGALFLIAVAVVALLAGRLAPYRYPVPISFHIHAPPFWETGSSPTHPLGTDSFGRDVLSMVLYGLRVTLVTGIGAATLAAMLGIALGMVSGWARGAWEEAIMRVADLCQSIPSLLVFALLMALLRRTALAAPWHSIPLATVGWANAARVVRGYVLVVRDADYVVAARSIGASDARILLRHVLAQVLGPAIVMASFEVPAVIIAEGFLSAIGLGVAQPELSISGLMFEEFPFTVFAPEFVLIPASGLVLISLAFTALGDGLQRALEPWETW